MRKIEITLEQVMEAYKRSRCGHAKKVLEDLFGKEACGVNVPTLDDYRTIRSYEDACKALGMPPILNDNLKVVNRDKIVAPCLPKHIVALMKLETISRALWGRNFEPQPDPEGSKWYYYPFFALYTKKEIEDMSEDKRKNLRKALLGGGSRNGACAGFGYLSSDDRSSDASAGCGFRLCQETEVKAEYFGKQFLDLWADYLSFNFNVTHENVK